MSLSFGTLSGPAIRVNQKGRIPKKSKKPKKGPVTRKEVAKIANKQIAKQAEKKYHLATTTGAKDWAGACIDLTGIAQGDTDITRDGDELYLKSIRLKSLIQYADTYNACRTIIFQWYDDTTPTPGDVLSPTYVGGQQAPLAPYKHDLASKFKILFDKTILVDTYRPHAILDTGYITGGFKRRVHFTAGGTTGVNKLYLLQISDSGVSTHPTMIAVARLNFTDS